MKGGEEMGGNQGGGVGVVKSSLNGGTAALKLVKSRWEEGTKLAGKLLIGIISLSDTAV